KDQYSHKTAVAHWAKQGINKTTTEQIEEAKANGMLSLTDNELYADYIIMMADGATVTVGEILDNPDKYHNKETKDPLEPEYNEHKTVGKLYIKGQEPRLYSNAHGGVTFRLKRQSKRIKHDYGDTYRTTQETLALMRVLPTYYDMGDNLVSVRNGAVMPFSEDLLGYNLGGVAQYYQTKTRKVDGVDVPYDISIDPPIKTLKQILAMRKMRELKPLNAVINAPTITENNHIVGKQGYDAKTSL
ncbi:hypothetical protein, partial [Aeromonas sp. ARM81]|uniref:hypothetical protein n=1 Tax=Aeromonas sp. ARM81 TaxID=1747384 RepID=UPI000E16E3A8